MPVEAKWTPALLAALIPAGEADMLAALFTPDAGAVTALARGLARPDSHLAARLKPADELRVGFVRRRGAGLLLTGCETEHSHGPWRDSLAHLALYWFMLECATIGSGTPELNADVYRLLVNLLRSAPDAAALPGCASGFSLKLLALHGLLPDLLHCQQTGNAFAPDEPVFLFTGGEGLIGRAAYNARYARSAGLDAPTGLLRLSPQRRRGWLELLTGALLAYPQSGADLADSAALLTLAAHSLADLAHRPLRTLDFLAAQWKLPAGPELALALAE